MGGGLGGLWAALLAKENDPSSEIVVLEAESIAAGATGRSGGFINSSLTHGIANGVSRFPEEMPLLERLGRENLDRIVVALDLQIGCDLELNGDLSVALEPHEEAWLAEDAQQLAASATKPRCSIARRCARSSTPPSSAPACGSEAAQGSSIRQGSPGACADAASSARDCTSALPFDPARVGSAIELSTPAASSGHGTRCWRPAPSARHWRSAPPHRPSLGLRARDGAAHAAQWSAVGWHRRQGVSDVANQFHYYRLTADGRILWGGYDAIYHFRNGIGPQLEQRDATFARLAHHFFRTFPQLEDVRFTHRWGGPIDTCSRFLAFYGLANHGPVAYAAGHTGLGIGASRFGARVALDLLAGRETEATRTRIVRSRPLPFPPEPLRWTAIQATRRALAAADRRHGRRGPWLRLLDRLGLGYDSWR